MSESKVKNTISVSVSIADILLEGDSAAAKAINAKMRELGIPDGTPIEVELRPRKYDYEAIATW